MRPPRGRAHSLRLLYDGDGNGDGDGDGDDDDDNDDDGDGDDDGDDDGSLELLRTNTPCARHRFQWRPAHGQSKTKIGLPPDFKNPIHNKTTPQTIEQI